MGEQLRCEPLADVVFNYIFSDDSTKVSMLEIINAVLESAGDKPIMAIKSMKSQYDLLGENKDSRRGRLDIRAVTEDNVIFDIEVQLASQPYMNDRSWFYGGRILSEAFHEGEHYHSMPRVRVINLLNFTLRNTNDDYLQPIGLYYKKEPLESASDAFIIYNVELPKFRKHHATMNSVLNEPLASWLYLLDKGYKDEKEMEAFTSMTEGMRAFAKKYNYSLKDSRLKRLYEYDLSARRDYESGMYSAKIEGKAEGKVEGMVEGIAIGKAEGIAIGKSEGIAIGKSEGKQELIDERVRYALETNMPIDVIRQILGATPEQMDIALKKANYYKS